MKKLYALQGHSKRGKTTTLKMLILEILEHYNTEFVDVDGRRITAKMLGDELAVDFKNFETEGENVAINNWCGTINIDGIKVAINTSGDDEGAIESSVKLFDQGADIGFCAVRTKGCTINKLDNYATAKKLIAGDDYFVISKMSLPNGNYGKVSREIYSEMNEIQVKFLFKRLQMFIEG